MSTTSLQEKVERWLNLVSPYNRSHLRLNPEKSALIVVDMQNFFLDPASPTFTPGGVPILPNVKRLIDTFRDAGRPVLFTRHVHHPDGSDAGIMGWWWDGMCIDGSPESEVHADIAPRPQEKQILKHRYSAFYNTDLEVVLRGLGVEDVVIAGIMTNMCCESTARDAYYRDYRVFIPADGTGAVNDAFHEASLLNLSFGFAVITTTEEIAVEIGERRTETVGEQ